ncbi:hypothetical protein D3C72_838400 [compost metagenome]
MFSPRQTHVAISAATQTVAATESPTSPSVARAAPTARNGSRLPKRVRARSLHGPTRGKTTRAVSGSAAMTAPISSGTAPRRSSVAGRNASSTAHVSWMPSPAAA